MPFERDPNELGVLWEKSSARGPYMTGTLEIAGEKHQIVLFKNGNKRSAKAPDWRILRSKPREKDETLENEVGHIPGDYGDPPF